nr:hypothetical protein GCM10017745_75170 [Saccharothrix mutabilis subsp. capreolus]
MELYLVVFNSHDGSAAFRVSLVPFRVACANQLPMVIRDQVASVAIRHTRNATINVAEIRSKLRLMYGYAEAFEQQAQRKIEAELSTDEIREFVETVWPVNDATAPPRTRLNADRRRHQLMRLWTDAGTQHNIRGTRWAGLQAITEYLDHYEPSRDAHPVHLLLRDGRGIHRRHPPHAHRPERTAGCPGRPLSCPGPGWRRPAGPPPPLWPPDPARQSLCACSRHAYAFLVKHGCAGSAAQETAASRTSASSAGAESIGQCPVGMSKRRHGGSFR